MSRLDPIPIAGKFLLVLCVFGVLVGASARLATGGMREIDARHGGAIAEQGRAALDTPPAGRALLNTRLVVAERMVAGPEKGDTRPARAPAFETIARDEPARSRAA